MTVSLQNIGRVVREVRPTSDVTYTYDGASPRVLSATDSMSGETVIRLYNDLGEAVGQVKNGVTNRTDTTTTTGSLPVNYFYDEFGERIGMIQGARSVWNRTTYETISQEVYRVVTSVRMTGSTTNAVRIQKTQLTGLSDSCRRHDVTLTGKTAILAAHECAFYPSGSSTLTSAATMESPSTIAIGS